VLTYDDELPQAEVGAVFDAIGGDLPRRLLTTLRPRGAMVLYGTASGTPSDLGARDLGQGSYYLTQAAGKDYSRNADERAARTAELLQLAASGSLSVEVGKIWPLEEAAAAWAALESRATTGKLLLSV
jgi:NADPH2:quinone reductase